MNFKKVCSINEEYWTYRDSFLIDMWIGQETQLYISDELAFSDCIMHFRLSQLE